MDLALTAKSVTEALRSAGHDAWTHAFGKDPEELISRLRSSCPDAVFNLSECPDLKPERRLHACALLELLHLPRIPGTGRSALGGSANSKALSKQLMIANEIPTPALPHYCRRSGRRAGAFVSAGRETREPRTGRPGSRREPRRRTGGRPAPAGESAADGVHGRIPSSRVRGRGGSFNVGSTGDTERRRSAPVAPPAELDVPETRAGRLCTYESKWDSTHPSYAEDRRRLPRRPLRRKPPRAALGGHPCLRAGFRARGYARSTSG